MRAPCTIPDCGLPRVGHGLCSKHYYRQKRKGTTELNRRPTLDERFWSKVEVTDGCWLWTASLNSSGYGQFWINDLGRNQAAHLYLLDEIPDSLTADHLCHTVDPDCVGGYDCAHRRCVNPNHIELVTRGENSARGKARLGTCSYGHEWTPENTLVSSKGWRSCRTCHARRERDRKARLRGD